MKEYYDRRATEYDDWWERARARPGWDDELTRALDAVRALPGGHTLDVACGTGYLTRRLPAPVTGLDQSARMLEIARSRVPDAELVVGDALALPFPDGRFDRVFASYFYCHLEEDDARRFRAEARRVARELVVLGSRWNDGEQRERWEERRLSDGTTWPVYKRVFDPDELAAELGGEAVHAGRHFVVVRA